jgi:hypothetical protein
MDEAGVIGGGVTDFDAVMPHPLRERAATNAADAVPNLP